MSFECPRCGAVSHNPNDERHGYCGRCHAWTREPPMPPPPGFWMHETSGRLRPAVEAYLLGQHMAPDQIASLRAYLRQWIMHPAWRGPGVAELRAGVDGLISRRAISDWLDRALEQGIDPL